MQNLNRTNKRVKSLIQATLVAIVTMGIALDAAIAHNDEMPADGGDVFYDQLDASPAAPKGITREYIAQVAKRTGINPKELMSLAEQDVCKNPDVESVCAYFGNQTVYKARNLAWELKSQGASDDTVLESFASVLEIGLSRNLNEIYGEKGLADKEFDERNSSEERNRLLCGGLKTAIDQQQINSTNPIYGRNYRLVTCAAGLNWRATWSILWWEWSAQAGLVVTHSRFSRRVLGFWHLTGADDHICSSANAMGNSVTNCNSYNWGSPVSARANFLFNQPAGAVFARGHAHKLGHNFNTQINF
ncbi:MAG: hypothetical protein WD397_08130 [Wenzhouxiangellaceae bacterium]